MRVIDLSTLSMVGGSGIAETKIPLWWSDGTSVSNTLSGPGPGGLLADGSSSGTNSTGILFTLSSTWPTNMQFAFEATLYSSSASYSVASELWDFTVGSQVGASVVSITSASAIVARSSKFTLTNGHNYGVALFGSAAGGTHYLIDASLIVFPQ